MVVELPLDTEVVERPWGIGEVDNTWGSEAGLASWKVASTSCLLDFASFGVEST